MSTESSNAQESAEPGERRRLLRTFGAALATIAPVVAVAADGSAPETSAVTRADLADTGNPASADALIGVKSPLRGSSKRTQHSKNADFVSAFDFMPQDKIDAVVARRSIDVTDELQAAISASPFVWLPDGTYRISKKIAMRTDSHLLGQSQHGVVLSGADGSVMLEFPYFSVDCTLRNIYFAGAGATAVSVASGGGPFQGYLVRAIIEDCHFDWQLAYGINADLIYARIARCSFGYYGRGKNPGTLVGIRSFSSGTNYTNLNTVSHSIFSSGTPDTAACELHGGLGWDFFDCDWSHAGMAVRSNNIQVLRFDLCWFEANTSKSGVVQVLASENFVEFRRCIFQNNKSPRLVQWSSKAVRGLLIENCNMGLAADSSPVFDDSTNSYGLLGSGALSWRNNTVSGGSPANSLVTALNSGDISQARGWAIVNTSGSVVASSDPALRVKRSGTGDISLGLSNPGATSAAGLCVVGTGRAGNVRAFGESPTGIRVKSVDATGRPIDDIVNLSWFGA